MSLAVLVALGALLSGCAQLQRPAPGPGEDAYDEVHYAPYRSVDPAARGVKAEKPRYFARWIFMPPHRRPPRPAVRINKIHPDLRRMLALPHGPTTVTVMVTFEERLQMPRFPNPAQRIVRGGHSDSAVAKPFLQRTRIVIDSIRAERFIKYAPDSTALVDSYSAHVLRTYWMTPAMLVEMPLDNVRRLANRVDVIYIRPNVGNPPPQVDVLDPSGDVVVARRQIGTDPYLEDPDMGYGSIGIIDTGVRATHRLLRDASGATRICASVDCTTKNCEELSQQEQSTYCPGSTCGTQDCDIDDGGHGTSTAAILVGVGDAAIYDSPDRYRGITRGPLDSYRVYSDATKLVDPDAAVGAIELAIARQDKVIVAETQETTLGDMAVQVENAYKMGYVVVGAVGDFEGQVGVPADNALAIGVGDYQVQDTQRRVVFDHGAGPIGGRLKPDVLAPSSTNTAGDKSDDAIHPFTATSGATPYAAGATSLLRDWMTLGKMDDDVGNVFAQLILAGQIVGPYDSSSIEGAGPISLPTRGEALWGKVWVSPDVEYVQVPVAVSGSVTRIDAAIWWPQETAIAEGSLEDTHNNVDLEIRSPGWFDIFGETKAKSASPVGVFERAAYQSEDGSALATGNWLLRIRPSALVVSPQTVYWAVALK